MTDYLSGYHPKTGICWLYRNKGDGQGWRCR
jgi:hypothetical protein